MALKTEENYIKLYGQKFGRLTILPINGNIQIEPHEQTTLMLQDIIKQLVNA